jgi:cobalamin biosynthesis protein CobT
MPRFQRIQGELDREAQPLATNETENTTAVSPRAEIPAGSSVNGVSDTSDDGVVDSDQHIATDETLGTPIGSPVWTPRSNSVNSTSVIVDSQASTSSDSDAANLGENDSVSRADNSTDSDATNSTPSGAVTPEDDDADQQSYWADEEEGNEGQGEEDEEGDEDEDDVEESAAAGHQSTDSTAMTAAATEAMHASGHDIQPRETREASLSPTEPEAKRRRME